MADHTVNLKLILDSFTRGLNQATTGFKKFTSNTKKQMSDLNKMGKDTKNVLSGNWQLFGGAIAGAAIYGAAKKVMELDDAVRRIAVDSSMSGNEMLAFKDQILATSMGTGTAVNEVTALGSAALHTSKDVKFVREELAFMNQVMQASGASGQEVGNALGDIKEKSGLANKDFESLITSMYAFGKTTGRESTFKDILPSVPGLLKTFKAMNPKATFKETQDYLLQSMFLDDPTALSKASRKMLKAAAKTMNKNNLVALGFKPGSVPTISAVIEAAKKKTDSYEHMLTALQPVFGMSITELGKLLGANGEWDTAYADMKKNMGAVGEDAAKIGQGANAAGNKVNAMITTLSNATMGPVLKEMADAVNSMSPEDVAALGQAFQAIGKGMAEIAKAYLQIPGFFKNVKEMGDAERANAERAAKTAGGTTEDAMVEQHGNWMHKWLLGKMQDMAQKNAAAQETPFGAPVVNIGGVVAQFPGLPPMQAQSASTGMVNRIP